MLTLPQYIYCRLSKDPIRCMTGFEVMIYKYYICSICIYVSDWGIIPKGWPVLLRQTTVFLLIEGFYYLGNCILIQRYGVGFFVDYRHYSFENIFVDHSVDDTEVRRESGPGRGWGTFMVVFSAEKCPLDTIFCLFECLLILLWCCNAKFWIVPAHIFSSLLYKA